MVQPFLVMARIRSGGFGITTRCRGQAGGARGLTNVY